MQSHDSPFALRQPLERGMSFWVVLHPLGALGDEHHHPIGLVDESRAFGPWFIGLRNCDLESAHRREQLFQDSYPSHELVRTGRVSIGSLADEEQMLDFGGVCGRGICRTGAEAERHAKRHGD